MKSAWTVGETFNPHRSQLYISVLAATENGFSIKIQGGDFEYIPVTWSDVTYVNIPDPSFTWIDISDTTNVAQYTLSIWSSYTGQEMTVTVPSGCGVCDVKPDYLGSGWKWSQGAHSYSWRVTGEDSTGKKVAESPRIIFNLYLLNFYIGVQQPQLNAVVSNPVVDFTFQADTRIEQFRIVFTRNDKTFKTAWTDRTGICVEQICTFSVDLTTFPRGEKNGRYYFKIYGRHSLVARPVNSTRYAFTFKKE